MGRARRRQLGGVDRLPSGRWRVRLIDPTTGRRTSIGSELGRWVDHLRQMGIRGFLAEHTDDADFPMDPIVRQTKVELARRRKPDETAASGTSDDVESHRAAAARARAPKGGRPKPGR